MPIFGNLKSLDSLKKEENINTNTKEEKINKIIICKQKRIKMMK